MDSTSYPYIADSITATEYLEMVKMFSKLGKKENGETSQFIVVMKLLRAVKNILK